MLTSPIVQHGCRSPLSVPPVATIVLRQLRAGLSDLSAGGSLITWSTVLCALVDTARPFCVLLPSSVLFTQLFRNCLPEGVQLVLPRRVKVCKTGGAPVPVRARRHLCAGGAHALLPSPSQFKQMVWICHGCELAKDVNFVGV